MPPRRGRSRRSAGSRAPDSDEDVHQMEELFDTLEYAPEKRLKLAVLQLWDDAQHWGRGTSRMLRDSGAVITWESFYEAFLLGNRGGSGSRLPVRQRKNKIWPGDDQYNSINKSIYDIHRVFLGVTFLATRAWLRPVSQGNRHFTVGGGR
ncbi:hypothetical protein F511_35249 [Dorcoceras hygrometricum]|uniref:Uncharacterized protein n=1 Tax=Dorcoceras hygrometricum TaxID=472368 RepID=A0A2Z7AUV0_9LAMI|nr:hypothetical protein F511_35249 [Dorcoceras hygrometricum]